MYSQEISATYLRAQQREVFDNVLKGQNFIIRRGGKPIAALIGIDEYEELLARRMERAKNLESSPGRGRAQ